MDSNAHSRHQKPNLKQRYGVESAEQRNSLLRLIIGVGLHYVIESIKADTPDLKINRVVKDEVREAAGISISSLDKYIGEAFQNDRPIDSTTLLKLSTNVFYSRLPASENEYSAKDFKYLQQRHLGILGAQNGQKSAEQLICDLIDFIKTKPQLISYIEDNIHAAKYTALIKRVFALRESMVMTNPVHDQIDVAPLDQHASVTTTRRIPITAATILSLLGLALPIFILIESSAELAIVMDYLVHEPGKHLFHIVILPCMVWAFLHHVSLTNLLRQRSLFFALVAAGFLSSAGQTYVQHAQSICDLVISDYVCNDIVEQLFDRESSHIIFAIYTSFLSLIPSLFSIVIFTCQLLELRNRGFEICSPLTYLLINSSYVIWAVARSYSEWHEVALSFEASALNDFAIYQYQSSLMIATMLLVSQILILLQIGKDKAVLMYLGFFVAMDIAAFWLATNIQHVAVKLHSFDHLNFDQIDYHSVIVGPLFYLNFMAVIIVFTYATIVKKTTINRLSSAQLK